MTDAIRSTPGWYPSTYRPGQLQYWDGSAWHEQYRPNPAPKPTSSRAYIGWIATILVTAVVAIGALVGISAIGDLSTGPDETTAASPTTVPSAAPIAPVRSVEDIRDEEMLAQGFEVGESGNVYYKAVDPSESTCGSYGCLFYSVYTYVGCMEGIYFEASIETEAGVSVGQANEITASLQPEQTASVLLEDYTRSGSKFRVTEVSCMG